MAANVTVTQRDAWGEIALRRDADFAVAPEFARAVGSLIAGGGRAAVVDLREVELVDAAFMRELYAARDALGRLGGDLIVVATRPAPLRALEAAGAHDPLTVVHSLEEGNALARAAAAEGGPGSH